MFQSFPLDIERAHLFDFVLPVDLCFSIFIEAERQKLRDQFLRAEQELAAAKGREQALQDQLLKEVNDSQERIKKQIRAYSELEVQLFSPNFIFL